MHPGSILLLWTAAALLTQQAEGVRLAALTLVSLVLALICARAQCGRLLVRVRILLLAIFVLFAWFTPGEALFLDWPRLSPSREGCLLALTHGGRLFALVCWVAVLLGRMSTDRLVSGLHALARPVFGPLAERVAVRLLLVLRYAESARANHWRDWQGWLNEATTGEPVRLIRERLKFWDVALPLAVLPVVALWGMR